MERQSSRRVVERFFEEILNAANAEAAPQIVTDDFCVHHPAFPEGPPGPTGVMLMVGAFHAAFPDLRYRMGQIVAEDEWVAVRWSAEGTNDGAFMGMPPTGKRVAIEGMDLFRVEGDRCAESWVNSDFLGLLQQLGALPPLQAPPPPPAH